MNRPASHLLLCCVLVAALAGCATRLERVQLLSREDANLNATTALDLVFVYDRAVMDALPKSAASWFAAKSALLAAHGAALDVVQMQVLPAQRIESVPLPKRHRSAIAVFNFANQASPDAAAVSELTRFKCVQITLAARDIAYAPC